MIITKVTELWNEDYSKCNNQADPEAVVPVAVPFSVQPADGRITVAMKPVSLLKIDFVTQ